VFARACYNALALAFVLRRPFESVGLRAYSLPDGAFNKEFWLLRFVLEFMLLALVGRVQ
jgi:hypothetical protein